MEVVLDMDVLKCRVGRVEMEKWRMKPDILSISGVYIMYIQSNISI